MYYRDISRALPELGNTTYVPSEIYGWFLLKKHVWLNLSDLATLKSQAKWYKLESVLSALRKMWGGESLAVKDQERRRASKAHMVGQYDNEEAGDEEGGAFWWNEHEDDTEDHAETEPTANEVWFEEALQALQDSPEDEVILVNFQEAKRVFYKDVCKALDRNRVNRGFYPSNEDKGYNKGKGKARIRASLRSCGKYRHKAQYCPQSGGSTRPAGKGAGGVGFVYTNWTTEPEVKVPDAEPSIFVFAATMAKTIVDCPSP